MYTKGGGDVGEKVCFRRACSLFRAVKGMNKVECEGCEGHKVNVSDKCEGVMSTYNTHKIRISYQTQD